MDDFQIQPFDLAISSYIKKVDDVYMLFIT